MKLIEHGDKRIVHLQYPNQYSLCSAFVRIQEFYESPFDDIRGKYFTLDEFMDRYAEQTGSFTYFTDWSGFNVPGNVVLDFWYKFCWDRKLEKRKKELEIFRKIDEHIISSDPNFYLIGTHETDGVGTYVEHEIAHAYYYLDPEFRKAQDEVYDSMDKKVSAKVAVKLMEIGYSEGVIKDETQAYFSTDDPCTLMGRFSLNKKDIVIGKRFVENLKAVREKTPA